MDISERYLLLIRFRRATKRDIFSRAVWKFDVVLNSEQQEIPEIRGFNSTLINYCTENVVKESIYNFVLIAEQGAAEI